jgi:hypothetical protein
MARYLIRLQAPWAPPRPARIAVLEARRQARHDELRALGYRFV